MRTAFFTRVGFFSCFGHKLGIDFSSREQLITHVWDKWIWQILVKNRVRVLGSGPHTPTHFFWEYPPSTPIRAVLSFASLLVTLHNKWNDCKGPQTKMLPNRRPVSSVGRAPDCCAGGRRFKPRPDQHSGSLNNWGESAAFLITSANG